jgi:hypothetical protein
VIDWRIDWCIGVELELLAPRGSSRRDLAERLGSVSTFFHPQSEPSLVPGVPVFDNLTLGFAVTAPDGAPVARCVDDLTLQDDLEREHPPAPGWFRIVSDDLRLLRLVARVGRADAGPLEALRPVAALFGTEPEIFPDGSIRITDEDRAPIAIAMPLPGERERPCELVTPPIDRDHAARLDALLAPARELGFGLARESATHVHYDAAPLCSARTIRNLIRILDARGEELKRLVGVNPACRRLGAWPDALRPIVFAPDFVELDWPDAKERLQRAGLTKYCDFNLRNFVHDVPGKLTFEVRVLPGLAETGPILAGAALFEAVLRRALEADTIDGPLLDGLPLAAEVRRVFQRAGQ